MPLLLSISTYKQFYLVIRVGGLVSTLGSKKYILILEQSSLFHHDFCHLAIITLLQVARSSSFECAPYSSRSRPQSGHMEPSGYFTVCFRKGYRCVGKAVREVWQYQHTSVWP